MKIKIKHLLMMLLCISVSSMMFQLTLLSLTSSFPFLQYTQIKGDMNPFDADCRLYFYKPS